MLELDICSHTTGAIFSLAPKYSTQHIHHAHRPILVALKLVGSAFHNVYTGQIQLINSSWSIFHVSLNRGQMSGTGCDLVSFGCETPQLARPDSRYPTFDFAFRMCSRHYTAPWGSARPHCTKAVEDSSAPSRAEWLSTVVL